MYFGKNFYFCLNLFSFFLFLISKGYSIEKPFQNCLYIPFENTGKVTGRIEDLSARGMTYGNRIVYEKAQVGKGLIVKRYAYDQVTCYKLKINGGAFFQQGCINFWFSPDWNVSDKQTHVLLSMMCRKAKLRLYLVKNRAGFFDYTVVINGKHMQILKKCEFVKGNWYYLSLIWNIQQGCMKFYINGKLFAQKAWEAKIFHSSPGSDVEEITEIWLGKPKYDNYSSIVGDGIYDELRVFSRTLTAEEICEIMIGNEESEKLEKIGFSAFQNKDSIIPPFIQKQYVSLCLRGKKKEAYVNNEIDVQSLLFGFKLKNGCHNPPCGLLKLKCTKGWLRVMVTRENKIIVIINTNKKVTFQGVYELNFTKFHCIGININNNSYTELYIDGGIQDRVKTELGALGKIISLSLNTYAISSWKFLAVKNTLSRDILYRTCAWRENSSEKRNLEIGKLSLLEKQLWGLKGAFTEKAGARESICLNGYWRVCPCLKYEVFPTGEWGYMRVPGSFRSPLFQIFKEKNGKLSSLKWHWKGKPLIKYLAGWYQRAFLIPRAFKNKHIYLKFSDIIGDYGRIYVNDSLIYSFVNDSPSYTSIPNPVRMEITKYITLGKVNTVSIFVYRRYSKLWRGKPSITDHAQIAIGDVFLENSNSSLQIVSVLAFPSYRKKNVSLRIKIENNEKRIRDVTVKGFFLFNKKKEKEFQYSITVNGNEKIEKFSFSWKKPRLWDEENPNVYKLIVNLYDKNNVLLDTYPPINFGFREFWIEDGKFYINGTETRLRMWSSPSIDRVKYYYGTKKGVEQYIANLKRIGYNATRCWYIAGLTCDVSWELKFSESDRQGFYHLQPIPPYEGTVPLNRYREHISRYVEAFGNHPSIIMWYTDFNTCSYPWNQDPAKLTDTTYIPREKLGSIKLAKTAERVIHAIDPSRETFQHAGGACGKIFGSMNYQSLGVPLQEREDWPAQWAKKHSRPLMIAECGFPFPPQLLHFELQYKHFYRGVKCRYMFLLAEHAARYFGENAFFWANRPSTVYFQPGPQLSNWPKNYVKIKNLIMRNTVRAWRGYGVSALGHFPGGRDEYECFKTLNKADVVYEIDNDIKNPGIRPDREGTSSEVHKHLLSDYTKPTCMFKLYKEVFSPLLVFLGGDPKHFTNKDHAFFSGEKILKSIVVVNDKLTEQKLTFDIKFKYIGNSHFIQRKTFSTVIAAGKIEKYPIKFTAPSVFVKKEMEIELKVFRNNSLFSGDKIYIQIFPPYTKPKLYRLCKIGVFDPYGQTSLLLKAAGIKFSKINDLNKIKNIHLLIIGKNALRGVNPDFLKELDASGIIKQGLKILIFEQKECNLANLIFERSSQRITFIREKGHPVLNGLSDEDLRDWRGGTDTVPAFVISDEHTPHYPRSKWKCGNSGIVAGWVIRKPQYGNWIPILDCGFNLMNTPLIELHKGRGIILFCQLDVTHRYKKDPVATKITDNILSYMATPFIPIHAPRTAYIGGDKDMKFLDRMGVIYKSLRSIRRFSDLNNFHVIIIGEGDISILNKNKKMLKEFINAGGCIFMMPNSDLSILPFKVETQDVAIFKTSLSAFYNDPAFRGICEADLYFRYPKQIRIVTEAPLWAIKSKPAAITKVTVGLGSVVIFNIPIDISGFWNQEKIHRVIGRIFTNMGIETARPLKLFSNIYYRDNTKGKPEIQIKDWLFKTDPKNEGMNEKWFSLRIFKNFVPIKVNGYWESFGITQKNPFYKYPDHTPKKLVQPYDGFAWYAAKFTIPVSWKNYKLFLKTTGPIDDNDWIWINGQLIGSTTFENSKKPWEERRLYPIPKNLVKFNSANIIVIRVFDKWGMGGINGNVVIFPDKKDLILDWSPYLDDLDFYDVDAFHNW